MSWEFIILLIKSLHLSSVRLIIKVLSELAGGGPLHERHNTQHTNSEAQNTGRVTTNTNKTIKYLIKTFNAVELKTT